MKNGNIDLNAALKPIANGLQRFHTTLFIVVVVIGLAVAVLMLRNSINNASAGVSTTTNTQATSFDTSTMDRLKDYHTSDGTLPDVNLPSGRINPFTEQ
jgi:hypothetical protein